MGICFDASIDMYFKIMMLLYADDTVILAETASDLQHSLNRARKSRVYLV